MTSSDADLLYPTEWNCVVDAVRDRPTSAMVSIWVALPDATNAPWCSDSRPQVAVRIARRHDLIFTTTRSLHAVDRVPLPLSM